MSKLTIRNLYRTYINHQIALKDIKLETKDGELVALIGPSECGKSVLLRIIAGLEMSTDGAIWLDEQLINETDAKARHVAMLFKNYRLYPELNVYDNLAFGLKLLKYPPSQMKKKVEESAKELGIDSLLNKMPSELNPVEYFVIALARALVKEPKLLLLDDPIFQIPSKYREEALKELKRIQKLTAVTTLFVTGRPKEAFYIGDRVAVMKEGELLQIGAAKEVYDFPINMSVAGAMMVPSISFMEITIEEKENHLQAQFFGCVHKIEPEEEEILRKKNCVGNKVILGIRPNDMEIIPIDKMSSGEQPCMAEIKRIKEYDGKKYGYFDYEGAAFAASIADGMKLAPEDKIVICYKNRVLLLFNKDNGEAILSGTK